MSAWKGTLLLGCFMRTYLVASAHNPRGLQNIGFTFAIEPALAALYGPGNGLRTARLRYARNYNCHPFFTPMLLGLFLNMEEKIAAGNLDPAVQDNLKDTMANTLSAIGDSFFNGTALSTWALTVSCMALSGFAPAALGLTLFLFILLQLFKVTTFILALRNGMMALFFLRRLDLINWGNRLKYGNALLLILFLWLALPDATALSLWQPLSGMAVLAFIWPVVYLLLTGFLVGRLHVPRVFVVFVLLVVAVAMRFSGVLPDISNLLIE